MRSLVHAKNAINYYNTCLTYKLSVFFSFNSVTSAKDDSKQEQEEEKESKVNIQFLFTI